jgi:uncharacterized membrane protein
MQGYRKLTKFEKTEQKSDNKVDYCYMIVGVILGILFFVTASHLAGYVVGVVIVLLALNHLDYSDVAEHDSGPCAD